MEIDEGAVKLRLPGHDQVGSKQPTLFEHRPATDGLVAVDSGQWEWETVPPVVSGSVWGFDENAGALIGIGKRVQPSAYFLYKYK